MRALCSASVRQHGPLLFHTAQQACELLGKRVVCALCTMRLKRRIDGSRPALTVVGLAAQGRPRHGSPLKSLLGVFLRVFARTPPFPQRSPGAIFQ